MSHNRPGLKYKDLRERILKIAASYVGQTTYGTWLKDNKGNNIWSRSGFNDPTFEEKIREMGWTKGAHYCNYTVRLVYKEAMLSGNNFISPTTSYPNNWELVNGVWRFKPAKLSKTLPNQSRFGLQTSFVDYTVANYKLINSWIEVDKNQNLLKKYIKSNQILPGDAIVFDWSDPPSNNDPWEHIGIYVGPSTDECSTIICIEGNTDNKENENGVAYKIRKANSIRGICQLIENQASDEYFK